jgi:hypothetical protein
MELASRLAPTMLSVSYREKIVGAPMWPRPRPPAKALRSARLAAPVIQMTAVVAPPRVSLPM